MRVFIAITPCFPHDEAMEYFHKLRHEYPDRRFETRYLAFPDGTDHLVTMEDWYWDKLTIIVEKGSYSEAEIIAFCYGNAFRASEKFNIPLDVSFYKHFAHYIYWFYQIYAPYPVSNENYREPASEETL